MKNILMAFLLLLTAASCQEAASTETPAENPETEAPKEELNGQSYGEEITMDDAIPYVKLVGMIPDTDSVEAKVIGTVETVCQVKGCWMDVVAAEEGQPNMRVRFKDYGFFVPKDISGRQVVMEGYAFREVTSVEDLRHYAEDEGLPQEEIDKITAPREDIKFLASGVIVLDETAQ